jgi:hypothetical protein
MGAARIEPLVDFDVTKSDLSSCENCQECRAANVLHFECFKRHLLSLDTNLQQVLESWEMLPNEIRLAMLAIVSSNAGCK